MKKVVSEGHGIPRIRHSLALRITELVRGGIFMPTAPSARPHLLTRTMDGAAIAPTQWSRPPRCTLAKTIHFVVNQESHVPVQFSQ